MKIGPSLAVIISTSILIVLLYYMNVKGIGYIQDNSTPLDSFVNATNWLSKNLKPHDIVLVPQPSVFYSLNPKLKDQIRDYKIIWGVAEVVLRANTSEYEVAQVRNYLETAIINGSRLKYLVIDWFYPYSQRIFKNQDCSDLGNLLHEVKRFEFQTPNTKWRNKLVICEVNRNNPVS